MRPRPSPSNGTPASLHAGGPGASRVALYSRALRTAPDCARACARRPWRGSAARRPRFGSPGSSERARSSAGWLRRVAAGWRQIGYTSCEQGGCRSCQHRSGDALDGSGRRPSARLVLEGGPPNNLTPATDHRAAPCGFGLTLAQPAVKSGPPRGPLRGVFSAQRALRSQILGQPPQRARARARAPATDRPTSSGFRPTLSRPTVMSGFLQEPGRPEGARARGRACCASAQELAKHFSSSAVLHEQDARARAGAGARRSVGCSCLGSGPGTDASGRPKYRSNSCAQGSESDDREADDGPCPEPTRPSWPVQSLPIPSSPITTPIWQLVEAGLIVRGRSRSARPIAHVDFRCSGPCKGLSWHSN